MRPEPDQPRQPSGRERRRGRPSRLAGRGRLVVGILLGVLFFLLISLRGIASFYTDFLWFDSVGLRSVWSEVLGTRALLTFAGGLIFFVLCWGNLLIAERLAPAFRPSSGDEDLIERYHEMIGGRTWIVRLSVSLFLALVIGVTLGASWNEWILFANRVDFGQSDATFGTDIGFYVFQLPFLTAASAWLFSSLVVIFIVTLLAHVVNGGIRFQTQLDRVTPQVKAHISLMLAVLALVQTGRYWLGRYELVFSTRGTVDGATYTDVAVQQRAIYLLMMISVFACGLFIANIWRRGWVLPGMAVGLWVLVFLIAGSVVPAFVQRVRVEPTESSRERPYIENNIAATREGYGLAEVDQIDYDWTQDLSSEALAANLGTMENVRLWDPATLQESFKSTQAFRSFYEIGDVDVDRYQIDGEERQVMLAARDLNTEGIRNPSWEATHLIYTNGYGVVSATANDKTSSGDPQLLTEDIPMRPSPELGQVEEGFEPRIYFGESKAGYVIVNTEVSDPTADVDAAAQAAGSDGEEVVVTTYDGADGIEIGSGVTGFLRKAAFSLRFGEVDPLVSGSLRPDSRVLLQRDVLSRVESVAPFLAFDHDPYLVMIDGRLQYVIDGYTTTRNYPNAQRADTGGLDAGSGLYGRSFNYVRNSVKATVDAYDGTITLYVVDDSDPLIQAYQKAFGDLFTDVSEAPDGLVEHFRYPEDLFTVQTQMWTRYHVEDPDDFYNGRDNWNVPRGTGASRREGADTTAVGPDGQELTPDDRYPSEYLQMQLPGEQDTSFVLLRPYVTATDESSDGGQNQLRAFIVADSDPESYGELKTYILDPGNLPDGPNLAADDIQADSEVGDQIRQLCTDNTVCTFAPPSIVPVADSLLYVQSFMVAGDQQKKPAIENVIVNYRRPGGISEVEIAPSLRGALIKLFGPDVPISIEDAGASTPADEGDQTTAPGDEGTGDQPTETLTEQESRLIDELVQAFADADAAARDGDQVEYARKIAEAADLAEQLQSLRESAPADGSGDGSSSGGGDTTTTTEPGTTTTAPETTTTTTAGA